MKNIDVRDILDEQNENGVIYKLNDELYKFMTSENVINDYVELLKNKKVKGSLSEKLANQKQYNVDNKYVVNYCLSKFAKNRKIIDECTNLFGESNNIWNVYQTYRGYVLTPLSYDTDINKSSIRNMIYNISNEAKLANDDYYNANTKYRDISLRDSEKTLPDALRNCITMYIAMNERKSHNKVIGKKSEDTSKHKFDYTYTKDNFITKFIKDWKNEYGEWDIDKWNNNYKLDTKFDNPSDLFKEGVKVLKIINWANINTKDKVQKYIDNKHRFNDEQKQGFIEYLKKYDLNIFDTVAILTNKINKLESETDEKKNKNKNELNKLKEKLRVANKVLSFANNKFNSLVSPDSSGLFSDLIQRVRRVNNFALTGKFYFSDDNDDDDIVDEVDTYVDENDSEAYCNECGCEVKSGWQHCPECGNSLQ